MRTNIHKTVQTRSQDVPQTAACDLRRLGVGRSGSSLPPRIWRRRGQREPRTYQRPPQDGGEPARGASNQRCGVNRCEFPSPKQSHLARETEVVSRVCGGAAMSNDQLCRRYESPSATEKPSQERRSWWRRCSGGEVKHLLRKAAARSKESLVEAIGAAF